MKSDTVKTCERELYGTWRSSNPRQWVNDRPIKFDYKVIRVQIIGISEKSYRIKLLEDGFRTMYANDVKGKIITVRKRNVRIIEQYDYSDSWWNK